MGKGTRSPLLGYNHNVRYRGRVYHVQTEDSGPGNPHIFTHMFYEGTILASKRHNYDGAAPDETVRALMQGLHKAILKELKLAQFDAKISAFFGTRREDAFLDGVSDAPSRAPEVVPGALDLDALPPVDPTPPPVTPTPPPVVMAPARGVPGPGVYSMKGGQERPFDRPFERAERTASPAPVGAPTPPPVVITPPPVVVAPVMRTSPPEVFDPASRPPVVVIRPPVVDRRPRPMATQPPPGGVVVQRTVVVGGGAAGQQQRPRRPAPPVPYVVKEGSHPIVPTARAATTAPPVVAAPRPAGAPVTPPPVAASTISDKSLDEVILAYLSQDDETRPR